jgi:hypothetical protein
LFVEHIAVVSYVGQVAKHYTFCTTLGIDFIDEGFGDVLIGFANSGLPVPVTSFA